MPAFAYGTLWLLKNERTDEVFNNIGFEYCESRGRIRDETLIESLDIEDGDILSVIPAQI